MKWFIALALLATFSTAFATELPLCNQDTGETVEVAMNFPCRSTDAEAKEGLSVMMATNVQGMRLIQKTGKRGLRINLDSEASFVTVSAAAKLSPSSELPEVERIQVMVFSWQVQLCANDGNNLCNPRKRYRWEVQHTLDYRSGRPQESFVNRLIKLK